jgi:hypothetical protein
MLFHSIFVLLSAMVCREMVDQVSMICQATFLAYTKPIQRMSVARIVTLTTNKALEEIQVQTISHHIGYVGNQLARFLS